MPSTTSGRQFLRGLKYAACVIAAVITVILLTGGRFHRLGMAASELGTIYSGKPGLVGKLLSPQAAEEWARYHRDALVKQGRLVHRNFRFERIPCPSPLAAWMQQQFIFHLNGRAIAVFSTMGRGRGDIFEVNLWCEPEHVESWDAWFDERKYVESSPESPSTE